MRLLFVHEVDYALKPVFEMHEFPEYLHMNGHDVTFLDYQESRRGSVVPRRCYLAGRSRSTSTVSLISTCAPIVGIIGRIVVALKSWWDVGRILRARAFDAVVLYGVPTNGPAVCWWGRRLGVPVMYRAIDVSHQLRATVFRPLVRCAERFVARWSSHVSVHNSSLGQYLLQLADRPIPISVDVPAVDLGTEPTDAEVVGLRRRLGVEPSARVILYRGTIYRFSGLVELVELVAPFLRMRSDVVFLIVGDGEHRTRVEDAVVDLDLGDVVRMAGFVDRSDLYALFRLASVSVNPFRSSLVTNAALPTRVLQSLRAGIPCVSTPLEGLRSLLPESQCLRYRSLDNSFVDAIRDLLDRDTSTTCSESRGSCALPAMFDSTLAWKSLEARVGALVT